jgi:hypothetical protein
VFDVPDSRCPKCQRPHNGARRADDSSLPPKPGDLAVCTACGQVNHFAQDMSLENLPLAKWRLLPLETRCLLKMMQRTVQNRN